MQTTSDSPRASLASSSESEPGGHTPPPRKRARQSLVDVLTPKASNVSTCCKSSTGEGVASPIFTEMHRQTNGSVSVQNGGESSSHLNGEFMAAKPGCSRKAGFSFSTKDRDVVRLIGQYLRNMGLE